MTEKQAWLILKLCDKLTEDQLIELGSYLLACAIKGKKPTQGTK